MTLLQKYGPWAIIAGASEGTGRAFALQLAAAGINCILLARRAEPLAALADEIRSQYSAECLTIAVDLSTDNALDTITSAIGDREVGLFISNAGADTTNRRFLDADINDWISQINRNIITLTRCCHWFGGKMRERGRGGIILVGSGSCYGGAGFMAVYSGTKAFDLCFGEGLWIELQPHGVDVLNLILGRTDTPAFRESLARSCAPIPPGLASPEEVARVGLERLPFGPVHNWGQDDDVVGGSVSSAAARRERVLMIDQAMKGLFGKKSS